VEVVTEVPEREMEVQTDQELELVTQ